jgi:beta-phosphoglucomutase-like phosphatase (HAD superfamily)
MAVATSTRTKRATEKLGDAGLLDYFKIVIGGDQVEQGKPDPEIYLKAASALSSAPSRCLALEDSANGVKAAVAAGMTVVQIPDLVPPSDELLQLGHIVLSSLADVPKYDF